MAKKNCRKFQPAEQGAPTLQTDRQTTDGRAIAYSEREREFTFAKNMLWKSDERTHGVRLSNVITDLVSREGNADGSLSVRPGVGCVAQWQNVGL